MAWAGSMARGQGECGTGVEGAGGTPRGHAACARTAGSRVRRSAWALQEDGRGLAPSQGSCRDTPRPSGEFILTWLVRPGLHVSLSPALSKSDLCFSLVERAGKLFQG